LKKALSLERIVALIGESELSSDDQVVYKRSKMLKNYMTQNFTVVETQTEKKGVFVSVKETVADVQAILSGKVDLLKPEELLFIGSLKDVEDKLEAKRQETAKATSLSNPLTSALTPANPAQPAAPAGSLPTQTPAQGQSPVPAAPTQPPATDQTKH
jgi:hypothetical protein